MLTIINWLHLTTWRLSGSSEVTLKCHFFPCSPVMCNTGQQRFLNLLFETLLVIKKVIWIKKNYFQFLTTATGMWRAVLRKGHPKTGRFSAESPAFKWEARQVPRATNHEKVDSIRIRSPTIRPSGRTTSPRWQSTRQMTARPPSPGD